MNKDLEVLRAKSNLDLYEKMLAAVTARAAYALERAASVGVSKEEWLAMSFEERDVVMMKSRKAGKRP